FFSSRRRHTRSKRDWSSDVCSSDLPQWLHVGALGYLCRSSYRCRYPSPRARGKVRRSFSYPSNTHTHTHFQSQSHLARCSTPNQIGRASCRERVENTAVDRTIQKEN